MQRIRVLNALEQAALKQEIFWHRQRSCCWMHRLWLLAKTGRCFQRLTLCRNSLKKLLFVLGHTPATLRFCGRCPDFFPGQELFTAEFQRKSWRCCHHADACQVLQQLWWNQQEYFAIKGVPYRHIQLLEHGSRQPYPERELNGIWRHADHADSGRSMAWLLKYIKLTNKAQWITDLKKKKKSQNQFCSISYIIRPEFLWYQKFRFLILILFHVLL